MKRLFCLLLAAMLLLSGCAQKPAPEPPAPQPVYGAAPALSAEKITVNGTPLSGVYTDPAGEKYLKLGELAAAINGAAEITPAIEIHAAVLTADALRLELSTAPAEGGLKNIYDGTDWYVSTALLAQLPFHPFADEEQKHTYYTAYPLAEEVPEGYKVPTLMYHAVSDDLWGIASLFVSPKELEKQLQYLTENGFTTITFEDLGRVDTIQKPVLLTFDDGYDDNYTNLFPLLKKYNCKATVFMIMGEVGKPYYLTADQIKEMSASGLVSFQSHTMTHEFLSTRTAEQLEYELHRSKIELARLTGKESFVLCYPTGKYSSASLKATEEHYQFGLLMSGKTYETGDNPLKITRKYVARSTSLGAFKGFVN